jgi:hypothetical protein
MFGNNDRIILKCISETYALEFQTKFCLRMWSNTGSYEKVGLILLSLAVPLPAALLKTGFSDQIPVNLNFTSPYPSSPHPSSLMTASNMAAPYGTLSAVYPSQRISAV